MDVDRGVDMEEGEVGVHDCQLLTSPEAVEFIKQAAAKQSQKEKKVEAKQEFVKVALKQKARRDRLVKKMEKAGEL